MLSVHTNLSKPRILIASIDYDDCISFKIGAESFIATTELSKHLIEVIKTNNYQLVVLMIGSSRQTLDIAKMPIFVLENLRKEIHVATHIPCLFDQYLLYDIGFSYSPTDEYKRAIKYLQMHKKSSEYQHIDIDYHFYDNDTEILQLLYSFYSKETGLMPFNLSSRLYQYDGKIVNHLYSIQGCGTIDFQFVQNMRLMAKYTGKLNVWGQLDIGYNLGDNCLCQFKAERHLSAQDICLELLKEIQFLDHHPPAKYQKNDYDHFIQSLYILHIEIEKDINRLSHHSFNDEEILAIPTIKIARKTYFMLLQFKNQNIINYLDETEINSERHRALLNYADECLPSHELLQISITALIISSGFLLGQCSKTIGIIWSNWERYLSTLLGKYAGKIFLTFGVGSLIKQSISYLLFQPHETTKQIHSIKKDLQQFIKADEIELINKQKREKM